MCERENIQAFYNGMAEKIALEWYPNETMLPTIREFLALIGTKPKILDLGCGTGCETKRLHDNGAEVVGIDFSSESINIARANNPESTFLHQDFFTIDKSIGSFNGVFACASLIHVPPSKMDNIIMKIKDVMDKEGILCVVLRDGKGERVHYPEVHGSPIERKLYLYSKEEIIDYVNRNGMEFLREGFMKKEENEKGWRCYYIKNRNIKETGNKSAITSR